MVRKEKIFRIWKEFSELYPDKESQLKALCGGSKNDFECSQCHGNRLEVIEEGGRCLKCLDCRSKTWITSSSFFKGIRKPLPYLAVIYFLEYGIALNSIELSTLTYVTQSTAWEIIKKISLVANESLSGQGERVPVLYLREAIYKRSRKTPSDCSPAQELEQAIEAVKNSSDMTISMLESADKDHSDLSSFQGMLADQELLILEAIGQSTLHADDLCSRLKLGPSKVLPSLTLLELDGLIESVAGNRYKLKPLNPVSNKFGPLPISQNASAMIGEVIEFACSVYRGISKKYSQLYVALLWMTQEGEKRGWRSILDQCRISNHFDRSRIAQFVTGQNLVLPVFPDPVS